MNADCVIAKLLPRGPLSYAVPPQKWSLQARSHALP